MAISEFEKSQILGVADFRLQILRCSVDVRGMGERGGEVNKLK